MKNILCVWAPAALLGTLLLADPAAAQIYTYSNPADGNLTATFSLTVVNGYAVAGSGTVSGTALGGTYDLALLTLQSQLPAGAGGLNPTANSPVNEFTWHPVAASGGADFIVDDVVLPASSNLRFDEDGVLFAIVDPNTHAYVGGLNIFDGTPTYPGSYSDNVGFGGGYLSYAGVGTLTVSPVSEPTGLMLAAAGLGLVAVRRRRV